MDWVQEMRYIAATGALGAGVDRDSPFAALDFGDGDMHDGQQYAPLLDVEVPL